MKRPNSSTVAVVLAVVATAVLARAAPGDARYPIIDGAPPGGSVRFDDRARDRIVITAPGYQLIVGKKNGGLIDLVDRKTSAHLLRGQNGCLWAAIPASDAPPVTGCAYQPDGSNRLSYRWDRRTSKLSLTYTYDASAERRANAVAEVTAYDSYFDLRLELESHWGKTMATVLLPADLFEDSDAVQAGYAPNYLPGIRLGRASSGRAGTTCSRIRAAGRGDYIAFDAGDGHLAMYTANPPAEPDPADRARFRPRRRRRFCGARVLHTPIPDTWVATARAGEPDRPLPRRRDRCRQEPRLPQGQRDRPLPVARRKARRAGGASSAAPLIKADPEGPAAVRRVGSELNRLPSPALVHPVAFQPRGLDEDDPDFLPLDPRWGTDRGLQRCDRPAHGWASSSCPT